MTSKRQSLSEKVESTHGVPWTELVQDLYSKGAGDLKVCKELGISKKKFDEYYAKSPQFREFIDQGREMAQCFWEEQSRENLHNKDFNTGLYKMRMQEFYGWSDKTDTKSETRTSDMDIAKLRQELIDRLPEVLKIVGTTQPKALTHSE